jgi:hypothetical protein
VSHPAFCRWASHSRCSRSDSAGRFHLDREPDVRSAPLGEEHVRHARLSGLRPSRAPPWIACLHAEPVRDGEEPRECGDSAPCSRSPTRTVHCSACSSRPDACGRFSSRARNGELGPSFSGGTICASSAREMTGVSARFTTCSVAALHPLSRDQEVATVRPPDLTCISSGSSRHQLRFVVTSWDATDDDILAPQQERFWSQNLLPLSDHYREIARNSAAVLHAGPFGAWRRSTSAFTSASTASTRFWLTFSCASN